MAVDRTFVRGTISASGFAGGHRFVVGCWNESPIGPFADIMWAQPDGRRVLLATSAEAADFITSIYDFDEVRDGGVEVESDGRTTTAAGHGIEIRLHGGRHRPIPFPRPLFITRFVEAPIARALMGVQTYGTSPRGAREWYQARGWRWVVDGSASIDGVDLGPPRAIDTPVGFGFSDPPARPSIVSVRVTIMPTTSAVVGEV